MRPKRNPAFSSPIRILSDIADNPIRSINIYRISVIFEYFFSINFAISIPPYMILYPVRHNILCRNPLIYFCSLRLFIRNHKIITFIGYHLRFQHFLIVSGNTCIYCNLLIIGIPYLYLSFISLFQNFQSFPI